MKTSYLLFVLLFSLASCERVDPEVSTQYIREGSREEQRDIVFRVLLNHYSSGNKDKQFYEVISERGGRFILNYNRIDQRLTFCQDPGSGWERQYINIAEADLQDFVDKGFSLLDFDLGNATVIDSVTILIKGKELTRSTAKDYITPKTNGKPSGY